MADIRIKDLPTTASLTASDDFIAIDGTTNGTRKLSAAAPAFLTSVTTPSLTSPAATNLTLGTTNSGAAITVLTTNKVGIGTTTPGLYDGESNDLVVFRAATAGITIGVSDTTSRAAIRFADGTTGSEAYRGGIEYDHGTGSGGTADSLHFRTAAALNMSINGSGNVLIGTTSNTGLTGAGGLKVASTTAGSSGAGALVVAGGLAAAGASYFGGAVTAMIAGTRTGINDDSVASFTPLVIGGVARGFFIILNSDYSESVIGSYFSSGGSYYLYPIVKSANVTLTNSTTMTGTTGTDGKMNIGFNNGIIYIENRLGGSGNFLYLPFGGTT
jgi:hypothetical protein